MQTCLLPIIGAVAYFAIGIAVAGFLLGISDEPLDDEDIAEIVLAWPVMICILLAGAIAKLFARAVQCIARTIMRPFRQ